MNFETSKNIVNTHFQGKMEVIPGGRNRQNNSFQSDSFRANSDSQKDDFFTSNSPSMEDLKKKYLGDTQKSPQSDSCYSNSSDSVNAESTKSRIDSQNNNIDDEIDVVVVKPVQDAASNSDSSTEEERTIILSSKKGPIGSQG